MPQRAVLLLTLLNRWAGGQGLLVVPEAGQAAETGVTAVSVLLDDHGEPAMASSLVQAAGQRPFAKSSPKYDDEVEKALQGANLSSGERQEVEKTLDDLLNRSNISLRQVSLAEEDVKRAPPGGHTVALRNHTDVVTKKGTDIGLKNLNEQHENLTHLVHDQAETVAHTSATMARNKEEIDKQTAEVERVADLYNQSDVNTKNAEHAYKAHLVALAIAKKRRDDLKLKADEARKTLESLVPQYNAAEYQLGILMSRTPWLKDEAKKKEAEEEKRIGDLENAEGKRKEVEDKLTGDGKALQEAISKLNSLNSDLKRIEDKMDHWSGSSVLAPVPLLLALAILGHS